MTDYRLLLTSLPRRSHPRRRALLREARNALAVLALSTFYASARLPSGAHVAASPGQNASSSGRHDWMQPRPLRHDRRPPPR
jgi:hypothetical protein